MISEIYSALKDCFLLNIVVFIEQDIDGLQGFRVRFTFTVEHVHCIEFRIE